LAAAVKGFAEGSSVGLRLAAATAGDVSIIIGAGHPKSADFAAIRLKEADIAADLPPGSCSTAAERWGVANGRRFGRGPRQSAAHGLSACGCRRHERRAGW
jgi:hypothetical protein